MISIDTQSVALQALVTSMLFSALAYQLRTVIVSWMIRKMYILELRQRYRNNCCHRNVTMAAATRLPSSQADLFVDYIRNPTLNPKPPNTQIVLKLWEAGLRASPGAHSGGGGFHMVSTRSRFRVQGSGFRLRG